MFNVKKEPLSRTHWLWIRNQIELKGLSLSGIARAHGYHKSAAGLVRDYRYPFFEKIIAEILGCDPQDIFLDRYTPDGKPIGRNYPRDRRRSNFSKNGIEVNGKEGNRHEKKA